MLIISKYKDYYDWLVGKYGIDKHIVLDRRKGRVKKSYELKSMDSFNRPSYDQIKVAICGTLYSGVYDHKGKFKWNEEIATIGKVKKSYYGAKVEKVHWQRKDFTFLPEPTTINQENNCPIVFVSGYRNQNHANFPYLKQLGISNWYSADKIYMDVYNWVSKNKEEVAVDNRTDIEKLQSRGFDKVTSFRNIK